METRYQIIPADPGLPVVDLTTDMATIPTLRDLQYTVHGAWSGCPDKPGPDLERVRVWHNHEYLDMIVDELGKSKGLPVNQRATVIYHANRLHHEHGDPPPDKVAEITQDWPRIYGTAVLFLRRVWY